MCGIKTNFICPVQIGMYISSEGVSRLVNADYHEQKELVVMEMVSSPPCFGGTCLTEEQIGA